ncbi:DinB family protein [Mesoterricola silvestris]|uniref:DinB-like domain-containing protein n=1 Tax=Mesoterricola silvestris TaxID=2927979 RepID=A0AA48GRS4_9BACT|nr:DinB family protein [Mesoterricola silvestris]BDU74500.1 hypothetical protein METEAL_36740 [Mesoterricola silvestris]
MLPEIATAARCYAVGDAFLTRLVGDFTEADWAVRDASGHDPRWLVGHLATYRNRVAAALGLPVETAPWEALFLRGTSPRDLPADLDIGAVAAAFHAAQAAMAAAWEGVTRETLAKPVGRTLPDGTTDVAGLVGFLAWHEAYHLGQLGIFRRLAGKPGAI